MGLFLHVLFTPLNTKLQVYLPLLPLLSYSSFALSLIYKIPFSLIHPLLSPVPPSHVTLFPPGTSSHFPRSSSPSLPLTIVFHMAWSAADTLFQKFPSYSISSFLSTLDYSQGVTKRCRLSLLTNSALETRVQMLGEEGSSRVSANESSCAHHVTLSPNKLWTSTSIFDLWL